MKDNKVTNWVKNHKDELIFVGSIAVAATGSIVLANNWERINHIVFDVKKPIVTNSRELMNGFDVTTVVPDMDKTTLLKIIDVRTHLRNLPQGNHPSIQKITEAAELGIELRNNQTLVSAHPRRYVA